MYQQYSRIQKKHLLTQRYTDTNQTRIGIFAPGRRVLLKNSLDAQLHRNFCLIPDAETAKSSRFDIIVVAADDGELMSTALMQYAMAINSETDFVFSDAVFGPKGKTLCVSENCIQIAAMSAELFLQALAQCAPAAGASEILSAAASLSKQKKHIPLALISFRRQIGAGDVFPSDKKRALVLSHEFSMTGAPIVLVSAIPVLIQLGFQPVVLGPEWGNAAPLFAEAGATVLIDAAQLEDSALHSLALSSDLVIANTIVETDAVRSLSGAPVPVVWWLHDAFLGYPWVEPRFPETQARNVKLCAVGKHATAAMHSVRPSFVIDQLIYGLPDYANQPRADRVFKSDPDTLLFTTVGSLESRKGQDILAKAITMLSHRELQKAHFLFVGRVLENHIYDRVQKLVEQYPDNVSYIPNLSRPEIFALMDQCDCVICSSTDDPMPTFVTEAAMFGKPGIVSEHTGTAGLITHGTDGFVYHNDNPRELCSLLSEVIGNPECLSAMGPNCRKLYENNFTFEVFGKSLSRIVESCTSPDQSNLSI